jgi:tRNA/rRNA methyltransferase
MTQMVLTPSAAADVAITQDPDVKVGIMFGRERSGLTNEEVAEADSIISIPSFKHFSSLNLAQAVNIVGSELWKRNLAISEKAPPNIWLHPRDGERLARRNELENFLQRLEVSLDGRNYQMNPTIRELNHRHIKNIFQRVMVTKAEVDMLHGVLSSLVKPLTGSSLSEAITADPKLFEAQKEE